MANKPQSKLVSSSTRFRSPVLLFILFLLTLSLLFLLSSISSSSSSSSTYDNPGRLTPRLETSFVASLERFLAHRSPPITDGTVSAAEVTEEDVRKLDDKMFAEESDRVQGSPYYPLELPIRVYVYEMPRKFTYDLLWLFMNTYRDTDNLTSNGSPVHRLIEQHSIDYWLWADLIAPESERFIKSVVRVERQEVADLFYIPFFTTISFFLLEKQQCKALYRVKS